MFTWTRIYITRSCLAESAFTLLATIACRHLHLSGPAQISSATRLAAFSLGFPVREHAVH